MKKLIVLLAALVLLVPAGIFALQPTVTAQTVGATNIVQKCNITGCVVTKVTRSQRAVVCDHARDFKNGNVIYFRKGITALLSKGDNNGVRAGCGRSVPGPPRIDGHGACMGEFLSPFANCGRIHYGGH